MIMKKNYFSILASMAFVGLVALFTACGSDDPVEEPVTDQAAGKFVLTNLTRSNAVLENGSFNIYKEDTIKVEFVPNDKYRRYKFTTDIMVNGTKVNNGYRIKKGDTQYTFTMSARYDGGEVHLSANQTTTIEQKYKVTIPYVLCITEDLRNMVNLEVTYTNENGKYETMEAEKLIASNYVQEQRDGVYTYMKNGIKCYTFDRGEAELNENFEGPLTVSTVPMLILNIPYYRFDIETEVKVTYKPRNPELTEQFYNIGRRFERKEAIIVSEESAKDNVWEYTAPMFTGEVMDRGQLNNYMKELEEAEDVIYLRIDAKGNVVASEKRR